jgi:SagB-type dehydrogenase family enzyme
MVDDSETHPWGVAFSPESIAAEFHVASRNQAAYKRFYKAHDIHYEPSIRELVTDAPLEFSGNRRVELPSGDDSVEGSVLSTIRARGSGRAFRADPLPASTLSTVLRHSNAVMAATQTPEGAFYRRAAANSGDLGSVEIFPIVLNVAGVDPGIYHFDSIRHDLAELRIGHFGDWLREFVLFQTELSTAAVALVLTAAVGRLQTKYGIRGYRFALLDIGHVSQNIYLVGTALGIQVCASAGFIDDVVDQALGLDGLDTASMLVVLVGR